MHNNVYHKSVVIDIHFRVFVKFVCKNRNKLIIFDDTEYVLIECFVTFFNGLLSRLFKIDVAASIHPFRVGFLIIPVCQAHRINFIDLYARELVD